MKIPVADEDYDIPGHLVPELKFMYAILVSCIMDIMREPNPKDYEREINRHRAINWLMDRPSKKNPPLITASEVCMFLNMDLEQLRKRVDASGILKINKGRKVRPIVKKMRVVSENYKASRLNRHRK